MAEYRVKQRSYAESGVSKQGYSVLDDNGPRKKKRRYNDGGVLLGFMLILLVVYLSGYIYTFLAREKVPETVVVFGSIEPVVVFTGVIVRDETVYRADAQGRVMYYRQDKERISAGNPAASVRDEETVRRHIETILNIEENILRAQAGRNFSSAVENEIRGIGTQLTRAVDNTALSINALDTQAMYTLTHRVDQLISHRNELLFNESQGALKTLSTERDIFQNQLGAAISEMRVRASGTISYKTDGFEEILTTARLRVLTKEETLTDVDFNNIYIPSVVYPGDPVFKTVNSNEWYIAAYLPLDQVDGWAAGRPRTIYVDDGSGYYGALETSVFILETDRQTGEAYVVLSVNRHVTNFLDRRAVSFKIKEGLTEGLKIPNSAIVSKTLYRIPEECITVVNGLRTVLRFNSGTGGYDQIPLTTFGSDNNFVSIIAELNDINLYDILIVPDRIGETRMITQTEEIKGVYVTNSGMAVFRRIILSGDVFENVNFTIIDPARNPGVRVQDRIVSDASNVVENQMIY
ncbi:MAG: hypothetical protein FWE91_03475 [Defluviitaleaceae bacterium]|nr:hypothetical protein [Defluviitaleaceae bacterium]MCL2835637.1 hypothetical protein [Defluviitaleaceae bacterium]